MSRTTLASEAALGSAVSTQEVSGVRTSNRASRAWAHGLHRGSSGLVHNHNQSAAQRMMLLLVLSSMCATEARAVHARMAAAASSWKVIPDMGTPRTYHAMAAANGSVVVIAGTTTNQLDPIGSVSRYLPANNTWGALPSMTPRTALAGAVLHGAVLAMGGSAQGASSQATV